jgi:NuA3 HAT complex component NTO1
MYDLKINPTKAHKPVRGMGEVPREEKKFTDLSRKLNPSEELEIWSSRRYKQKVGVGRYEILEKLKSKETSTIKAAEESTEMGFSLIDYIADELDYEFFKILKRDELDVPFFEIVMDRLEKEWFCFQQKLVNKFGISFEMSEARCNICAKSDSQGNNDIIYCDGCDLCVHQECYGGSLYSRRNMVLQKVSISRGIDTI